MTRLLMLNGSSVAASGKSVRHIDVLANLMTTDIAKESRGEGEEECSSCVRSCEYVSPLLVVATVVHHNFGR